MDPAEETFISQVPRKSRVPSPSLYIPESYVEKTEKMWFGED